MTALERRYRRTLRLLPAGYRQAWEEDMVSAFLQSMDGRGNDRPPLAERLSVVALALRLRLAGAGAVATHPVAGSFALMTLVHQAVFATVDLARVPALIRWRPMEHRADSIEEWLPPAYGLLWVAAFGCAVLGRVVPARILAVVAAAPTAVVLPVYLWSARPYLADLVLVTWPALCAAAVFAIPRRAHPSRRWLGIYLAAASVLATAAALSYAPREWARLIDLSLAWRLALLVGMIVVLAAPTLRRSSGLLIAFAVFSAGILLGLDGFSRVVGHRPPAGAALPMAHWLDWAVVGLGVACAVVGVLALRRPPQGVPGPA